MAVSESRDCATDPNGCKQKDIFRKEQSMPRIKLNDIPMDIKVSQAQIHQIMGGLFRLSHYDQQLQSVGDDAQLANIDLQNYMQKQQHMMQLLSSMMKTSHDTAMAVIRKMSG
jgi:hypothetical protein